MKSTLILFLVTSASILFGQNEKWIQLDQFFDTLAHHDVVMGSFAISENGQLAYSRSIGYKDLDQQIKADSISKYRIGSISKTFTSVLTMKAIEMGMLELDQTIDSFYPKLKNGDKITIKHLLQHQSGIHNFTNIPGFITYIFSPKSREEMRNLMIGLESDFEPGTKSEYSNSNYVLLTLILEEIFDDSYAHLLQNQIAEPLNLKNTYLGLSPRIDENECKSYTYTNNWELVKEWDLSIPLGAGSIISTPADLCSFIKALFKGQLVKKESLEEMKSIVGGFGLGLIQVPFYEYKGYGHTGGIEGFTSTLYYFPEMDISVALTCNALNFAINDIAIAMLSAANAQSIHIPSFSTYDVVIDDFKPYLGTYSSPSFPLKIMITEDDGQLIGQATGQSSFPLTAFAKDNFKFAAAGLILEFDPAEKTMLLKQGGGEFLLSKE